MISNYGQYDVPPASECVNFRVGQPGPNGLLPLDIAREAGIAKLAEKDPLFLQYGDIYGYPKFRQSLSNFLTKRYGSEVKIDHLMATNGITGCLSLILSIFTKSGDLIFAEDPTYFLAKCIFNDFKLKCLQVPQDKLGLDVEALEKRLDKGEIPVLMYVVPTAHNPSGRTLSTERRKKLAMLSSKYKFLLLVDEVYQLLTFPHITPPPPMHTFNETGNILALGSFSKIFSPGLRVGWLQGTPDLLKKIVSSGQLQSSGGMNPFVYGICEKAIDLGLLDKHLDWVRGELWKRYIALSEELLSSLPEGVTFEEPQGGYFCLVRFPEDINTSELLPLANEFKVQFLPGSSFSQTMNNYIRLSFSYYKSEELVIGARRLCEAIKEFLFRKNKKSLK